MSKVARLAFAVMLAGLMAGGCERWPFGESGKGKSSLNRDLDSDQVLRGESLYKKHCLKCHGEEGKGRVLDWRIRDADGHLPPPPLSDIARTSHYPTAVLIEIIREGSPAGQGKMPAWKGKLTEQEMQDVLTYIKSLWSDPVYQLWRNMERHSLEG
ncbi:MAG: cytochrome c [Sulfuriferula multivorans]|uniref:Cytochrome c n=1 Tax=Sulfuriferula multivorans TaxID=1559896 RepID=A0A7C9P5E1_9PROT|nr:cytochrome c [Sulfuriferula multivorans]